jgi:hypothetical protein
LDGSFWGFDMKSVVDSISFVILSVCMLLVSASLVRVGRFRREFGGFLCRSSELLFADLCVNLKASFASVFVPLPCRCLLGFEGFYVSDCSSCLLILAYAREEQEQIVDTSCLVCLFLAYAREKWAAIVALSCFVVAVWPSHKYSSGLCSPSFRVRCAL